jgi:hypothetical protein
MFLSEELQEILKPSLNDIKTIIDLKKSCLIELHNDNKIKLAELLKLTDNEPLNIVVLKGRIAQELLKNEYSSKIN